MVVTPNKRAKGDGSVYQRKDGRWVAELPLPEQDGKRRSMSRYAKTEAQAKVKLTAMRRDKIKNGGDLITGSINVTALMERWYTEVAEKTHKPKTAANERSVIRNHIVPAIGKTPLDKLSRTHFERLTSNIEAKGLGGATAILAHTTLSSAVGYAFKADLIDTDVSKKATRPSKPAPKLGILTPAQAKKLLQAVQYDRLGSRVAAAFLTSARQGELLGLELDRMGDNLVLDWQLQRVTKQHGCGTAKTEQYTNKAGKPAVRYLWPCGAAKGAHCPEGKYVFPRNSEHRHLDGGLWLVRPKSRAGARILPLRGPLRILLERRMEAAAVEPNPHGLLWTSDPKRSRHGVVQPLDGSPIDPRIDNEYWHTALVRAGLEEVDAVGAIEKKLRLHDARHTGASMMLASGTASRTALDLMGQTTVDTLWGYQFVVSELANAAMDGMASVLDYDPDEIPQLES